MLRIILGVVVSFIAWTILWLGSDQVLMSLSPAWYGAHQQAFELAMGTQQAFTADSTILIMHLIRAVIITILSGFIAAMIAGENRRSPLFLGVLLFLVGVFVQFTAWNYIPLWYHILFLGLLIPAATIGGKLKRSV